MRIHDQLLPVDKNIICIIYQYFIKEKCDICAGFIAGWCYKSPFSANE